MKSLSRHPRCHGLAQRRLSAALLVWAAAGLLAATAAPAPANLVENASFEDGLKGWSSHVARAPGTCQVDTAMAHDGKASVRVTSGTGARISLSTRVPVEPDRVYRIALWYRTEVLETPGAAAAPAAEVNELAEAQADTGQTVLRTVMRPPTGCRSNTGDFLCYVGEQPFPATSGTWRRFEMLVRTHPLAAFCGLEFNVYARVLWIDAVSVEAAEPGPGEAVTSFAPVVSSPLYEELLSDVPSGATVFPNWSYNLSGMRPAALKFGLEYAQAEQYAVAGRHRFSSTGPGDRALSRQYDVPLLGFVNHYSAVINKSKVGRTAPTPLLHPLTEKLMLEYIEALHRDWPGRVWALFYADEPFGRGAVKPSPAMFTGEDKDFWTQADREVREEFGGGVYGMPTGEGEEPFHWIAYRRWAEQRLFELFSRLQARAKALNPEVVLIGPDELSAAIPRDWERLAATWDLSTGQTLPAWSPLRQSITGFLTKFYVDLTLKPTCPFVQASAYDHAATPGLARALYSEVLRNGGSAFWINGVEWYDREFGHPSFNSPDRWVAMRELADTVRRTPRLRYPAADSAVLYSVDTHQAQPNYQQSSPPCAAAHLLIGPTAGGWFHFISEGQIERGSRNLADYKVIYVPAATYLRRPVAEALEAYARAGGTLVCTDPTALTADDRGASLDDLRERCFGVRLAGEARSTRLARAADTADLAMLADAEYPVFETPRRLEITDPATTRVLMRFADGSPGLVLRTLGQGRTLFFAANPLGGAATTQPEWQRFFRGLHAWAGGAVDLPIWRFQLPMQTPEASLPAEEPVQCLTGNHVSMRSSVIFTPNNRDIAGSYRYAVATPPEGQPGEAIAFTAGKLTDRVRAHRTAVRGHQKRPDGYEPFRQDDWSITWADTAQPLVIDIDFPEAYALKRLALVVAGEAPALRVLSGERELARAEAVALPDTDTRRIELPLDGAHRALRLQFDPCRDAARPLILAEVEVWGE